MATPSPRDRTAADRRDRAPADRAPHSMTPLQRTAQVVGAVFFVVGVLGFVPGITQDLGDLQFAGHESGAMLLGVFQVSWLRNLVHLTFGVAGLVLARSVPAAGATSWAAGSSTSSSGCTGSWSPTGPPRTSSR